MRKFDSLNNIYSKNKSRAILLSIFAPKINKYNFLNFERNT